MVGGTSKSFDNIRHLIFQETSIYHTLMDKVSRFTAKYLKAQARAGCNALMLFDSFGGMLGPEDYQELNLPYIKRIIAELKKRFDVYMLYVPTSGGIDTWKKGLGDESVLSMTDPARIVDEVHLA